MARMYRATGDTEMKEKAATLVTGWAEAFSKDRIPAASRRPGFNADRMHYAFDKTVCGLLDVGKYAGSKDALELLETLVDWGSATLLRTRHPGSPEEPESFPSGNEWYTLSENLYRAYVLTGNPKYKKFGDVWHYDTYWDKFVNEIDPDIRGLHAYSHVNTLSSAAMTYGVTADQKYLKAIVNAHDYFQRAQCYATGGYGPGESLMSNDGSLGRSLENVRDTFETPCGTWSIFKLSKYLLQFTGEARFGDWMEKALYNGIAAALPIAGHRVAALYGPVVLVRHQETVLVPNVNDISRWIVSKGAGLEFQAENRATAAFVPFYQLGGRTAYSMYFDLETASM